MFLLYFTGIVDSLHLLDAELLELFLVLFFQTFGGFSLFTKLQYDGCFIRPLFIRNQSSVF